MKTTVRLLLIILVIASFASCTKVVEVPAGQPITPIAGTWIVTDAAENGGNGWQSYTPSFATGIFQFYNDGAASYADGNIRLNGSWAITTGTNSFYDEYGNFYTQEHQLFQTVMNDYSSGSSLNLYFDDIDFVNSNLFIVTYYDGKYIEKVSFSRY